MKLRWINAGRVNGLRSQSIYHGMAYAKEDKSLNTIILSIPDDPYICIGYFQDPTKELDLQYCKEKSLAVIRRQTGGGAVFIDQHQMFVQWVFQPKDVPQMVGQKFRFFIDPMIETYKFFGIEAYRYKDHDVHVNGKKIVGTGAAQIGNAEVITGNFISSFTPEHMTGALKLPNDVMRDQLQDSLVKYMSSFTDELSNAPEFSKVSSVYKKKCEEHLGVELMEDDFTDLELEKIEEMEEKLSSDSWTYSINKPHKDCRLVKIHTGVWLGYNCAQKRGNKLEITLRWNEDEIEFVKLQHNNPECKQNLELLEKELYQLAFMKENILMKLKIMEEKKGLAWSGFSMNEWMETFMEIKLNLQKISGGI